MTHGERSPAAADCAPSLHATMGTCASHQGCERLVEYVNTA